MSWGPDCWVESFTFTSQVMVMGKYLWGQHPEGSISLASGSVQQKVASSKDKTIKHFP